MSELPINNSPLRESSQSSKQEQQQATLKSEDSGYSTDEGSSGREGTSQESSDSSEYDPSDEEGGKSLERKINFLRQKQEILQRASEILSEDDIYDASIALHLSNYVAPEPKEDDPKTIWEKAKDLLQEYGSSAEESTEAPPPKPIVNSRRKKCRPSPKHALIPSGGAKHILSTQYNPLESGSETSSDESKSTNVVSSLPSSVFSKGQWIAQALVWSAPPTTNSNADTGGLDTLWRVVSNPHTHSLGLRPPANISMKHAVSIQEAMALSDEARLLTQSTPPFCVVSANKAFLKIAGLEGRKQVIGNPVETLIRINQTITGNQTSRHDVNGENSLQVMIATGNDSDDDSKMTRCRIRVAPVVDRSRRRRLSRHEYSCMTHVLIRLVQSTPHEVTLSSDQAESVERTQQDAPPAKPHGMVGLVG